MPFSYSTRQHSSKKMSMSVWALQITSTINNIIGLFATTFLVSYIVQVNVDAPMSASLTSIALYYISLHAVMIVAYFLMNYLVDRTNRVWFYRLGILIKGAFIITIIFLGKDLARLSAVAGALYGIAESCYWSSYNVMKGEIIPRIQADNFVAVNTILNKLINIVFPILIGFMIDASTFKAVAFYVLGIVALQLIFSFFIKSQRPENSSFEFFKFIKKLRSKSEDAQRVKRFYPVAFGYGLTSICTSIVALLAIYTFRTNFNLGLFTALFSVFSVTTLLLFKRFSKVGHRKFIYLIFAVLSLVSAVIVAIDITKWSYIFFNVVETVSLCVLAYALDVQRTTILKKTNDYDDIAEHQTMTELCVNSARVLTYVLMLVLGITLDILGLKVLIVIISFGIPILCFFLYRMEKVEKNFPIEVRVVSVEGGIEEQLQSPIPLVESGEQDNKSQDN